MIWLLLACTGSDVPSADAAAQHQAHEDTSSPALPDIEQTAAQPTMTADEVARTIELALSSPPDPDEIIEAYLWLMSQGDDVCPGDEHNITDLWLYGCDALTGYSYAGVTDWLDMPFDEGGMSGSIMGIAGDFWIDTPEGDQLEAGGHSMKAFNPTLLVSEIAGSFRWSGGSDWLSSGYSGNLTQEYVVGAYVAFRGAANINGVHIAGHELTFPEGCNGQPVGGVSLRDPSGGWYRLDFDVCDSCTEVVFEGTPVGEACVDFSNYIEIIKGRL